MKYLSFYILLLFQGLGVLAQSPKTQQALEAFQSAYNQNDPEGVFALFNPKMQEAVDQEKATQLVRAFQLRLGELKSISFLEREGARAEYAGNFERGRQRISLSVDEAGKISGLLFQPLEDDGSPGKLERNLSKFQLPFKGSWFTVWGGDTKAQNYHVIDRAQRNAFDFLILGKGNRTYQRSGTRNEDYYAFGQPVYAICEAEVVEVITGVTDNKPGEMNPAQMLGNSVTLKTVNEEYIVYAHFREGSVKVKEGQRVSPGTILGECGNSGNSSEPHLHLHVMDGPDIYSATGVKCYFDRILVNGALKTDYSPVRMDVLAPSDQ